MIVNSELFFFTDNEQLKKFSQLNSQLKENCKG